MPGEKAAFLLLVGALIALLWSQLAVSTAFQTVQVSGEHTRLELTIVAEQLEVGRTFGLRRIDTKNEFFVRGKLVSDVGLPLRVLLTKDGRTEAHMCHRPAKEPCFFTVRIDTVLQGQFEVAIEGSGRPPIRTTASFHPRTVLMLPLVDGILRG